MPKKKKSEIKRIAVEARYRKFADAWIENGFRGIDAAITAGYKGKREGLWVQASVLLRKPTVRDYIADQLANAGMGRDEVLSRLRMRAEGAPILEFYSEKKITTTYTKKNGDETEIERYVWLPDIEKVRAAGLDHLVKGISLEGVIEWHDPMSALTLLAKHHKLIDADGVDARPGVVIIINEASRWERAEEKRAQLRALNPRIVDIR